MKGHIRQRAKGSWEITIDIGTDPSTGSRQRHFETVRGAKKDAQRRLVEVLSSMEKGGYVRPKRLTVAEWLEQWLATYVTSLSPQTVESYQMIIRHHLIPALGAIPLNQLQPQHLNDYYRRALSGGRADGKGGLSARTVQYHHRILSEALTHAVKMEVLGRNPASAATAPRLQRRGIATLAPEDVPRFLAAAQEEPHYALFHTALFTGLRLGELLGLTWGGVDLDLAQLRVMGALHKRRGVCELREPKSPYSRRQIALLPSSALLLREHKAKQEAQSTLSGKPLSNSDFVFSRPDGSPLDPGTVRQVFRRILRRAQLGHLRFHDLRHSHATLMLMSDVHPKIVQERLGHSKIAVTLDTYSHVLPGLQEAAVRRLEEFLDLEQAQTEDVGKMSAEGAGSDMPRGGVEPPTRGFSVRCSTT